MQMSMISIASLIITEFRKFRNRRIDFTKPITLITGQNGTAKSTVLGMLAQPFSFGSEKEREKQDNSAYLKNYHGLKLADCIDIAGNFYTYPCDKIFRLSKKHDTPDKRYIYQTQLQGIDFDVDADSPLKTKKLLTVKQARGEKLRFVTGPAIQDSESVSHNSGEGNFPHPVIYLSLGRLLPLAEVKDCKISQLQGKLTVEESKWYVNAYKEVFSIVGENPSVGLMDTKEKKKSIVPLSNDYDGESCSAGQDNIGRIFTALLSFRRLKAHLGNKYRGGLLLVDEIDSTLHPASQVRLMNLICREAEELALQVVATTHSLYLTEFCATELCKKVGLVHISKAFGNLDIQSEATLDVVRSDLKNVALPPPKKKKAIKVSVILEDAEAVRLLKFFIEKHSAYKKKVSISNIKGKRSVDKASHISGQYLQIFADNASKIPELQNVVFVPDGDMPWVQTTKNKNVVPLPGDKPIEVQVFEMLTMLPETDLFWSRCLGVNYCKQVAIGNYVNLTSTDIDGVKRWYRKQKPYWGNGLFVVFEKYYQLHRDVCDAFINNLGKVITRCEQEIVTAMKVK